MEEKKTTTRRRYTTRRTRQQQQLTELQEQETKQEIDAADDVRVADETLNDRILPTENFYTHDNELQEVIRKSRQEFMEQEKRIQDEIAEKQVLKELVSVPVARLNTWKKFSHDETETYLLDLILQIVAAGTTIGDYHLPIDEIIVYREMLDEFVEKHFKNAKLYENICHVYSGVISSL